MKTLSGALAVLLMLPGSLLAQHSGHSWDNLRRLKPGSKIIVQDTSSGEFESEFVSVSDATLTVRLKGQEPGSTRRIPRSDVVKVSTKHARVNAKMTLLMAASGAVLGALAGAYTCGGSTYSVHCSDHFNGWPVVAAGAGVGAAAFGVTTALLWRDKTEKVLYERENEAGNVFAPAESQEVPLVQGEKQEARADPQ
jgi:hypothetical protein